ncbi:MAG: hypothetical protein AUH86_18915 [Acidobacteria bacterium 13_1_40CM_4_58_4]|nr:MAG: hypothetical protein AUH86_18915 [Acidobacteria bacterium 13_1_40CM_4_58_4]
MSNVLNEEKKQQVIALGKLGWTLRRIEQATGVRRETVSVYLKSAGVAVRQPGGWGRLCWRASGDEEAAGSGNARTGPFRIKTPAPWMAGIQPRMVSVSDSDTETEKLNC